MVSLEIAAALAWKAGDFDKFNLEKADIISTRRVAYGADATEPIKVTVDIDGNGSIHQYSIPPADIGQLIDLYREATGIAPADRPDMGNRVEANTAFPKRMPLPDPVERLVDSDFIGPELLELHDEGLDLRQFEGTEPKSLNFHRGVEDDVVEEHLKAKAEANDAEAQEVEE